MRPADRCVRARAMAAGPWPDDPDVQGRAGLAVRGRRQRAMAAGARQRRRPDHDARAVKTRRTVPVCFYLAAQANFFMAMALRPVPDRRLHSETVLRRSLPRLAANRSFHALHVDCHIFPTTGPSEPAA